MFIRNLFRSICRFFTDNHNYYINNESIIFENNRKMLVRGVFTYLVILGFYTIFTLIHNDSNVLSILYMCFDGFHLVLTSLVFVLYKKHKLSINITKILVYIFEISVLLFFALEGVLAYRESHSLYIPIAIFLVVVVFNHHMLYLTLLTFLYISLFVIGSYLYKPIDVAIKDLEIGFATLVSSFIGIVFLAHLHLNLAKWTKKYRDLSRIDQFSGLLNKCTIIDEANLFIRKHKESNQLYVLAIIDLDNFKTINDTFGHLTGDTAISLFTQALRNEFQDNALLGRFGGDEFVVVKDVSSPAQFEEQLGDFMQEVMDIKIPTLDFVLSCSIGYCVAEGSNCGFEMLLEKADKSLYYVKNNGKGRWESSK